ncbi:MAG TPA: tRNA (guanosine(46)-N7)-methyltransferase TrmB [Firmicutes bacterium]|nr:tRNA (guanosine(46)-N7)-methyltransferase TrmB [Bacillota bacterium]
MEYIKIKNASTIVKNSNYVVDTPERYKNKWSDLFGNKNPIDLELGMGRGDFIIEMARTYPNRNFIGIEINDSQMVNAIKNLESKKLPNLKLINMDANKLDKVFGKEIDTIYLTFSEPWPKKIDERKRFTHPLYLKLYDKVFKKHKHIVMKTDNKGLFAYSLETLSQYWYVFDRVSLDLHNDENPIKNVMTNYEKQYEKEGRPIYFVDAKFEG